MSDVRVAPRALRAVETVAGLASAGLVVVGVVLVILQVVVPQVVPGSGLARAVGPGWSRALWQLAIGVAGEAVVLLRGRWPNWARSASAVAILAAAAAVVFLAWWA